MKIKLMFFFVTFLNAQFFFGQSYEVKIPKFNDEYSQSIKMLEAGQTDIDYLKFRASFLESKQYSIAAGKFDKLKNLEKEMYNLMKKKEYKKIIVTTKKMLTIDYTNMLALKILRQTYQVLEDSENAKKYKSIQFGLLNSIVRNGDGKTCSTAWPVVQISEEYFILQMLDAELISQKISNEGGICDEMKVRVGGVERIYFFDTSRIFAKNSKLLEK